MALTDNPYLPLYINDWLSNSKLKLCSAGAHGLMINIMALMHKSSNYGKIEVLSEFCYNKSDNKDDNTCYSKNDNKNVFALSKMLSKMLPFDVEEIEHFLNELLDKKVLIFDGVFLICCRMVADGKLSKKRSKSGKLGMKTRYSGKNICYNKNENFAITKRLTNADNENDIDIENKNLLGFDFKGGTGGTPGCVDVGVGVSSAGVTDSDPPPAKKEIRHKHGEYKRVLLTEAEYNKLVEEFGEAVVSANIRTVDEYVEGNGNKNGYKNFNLVIRKFIHKDRDSHEQNKQNQKTLNMGRPLHEHQRNAIEANKYGHL